MAGIDYGMGQTNIDKSNGIRFGVINMNALSPYAWDTFEPDYGEPTCPKCGNELIEYSEYQGDDSKLETYHHGCCDYVCEDCELIIGSDSAYGEEPIGHTLQDEEYTAEVDSYNDVFIIKSPYFTYADFCSPCAPGAGHLENPNPNGVKTYCFGHDWFEGEKAPYPVFSVETGESVLPAE